MVYYSSSNLRRTANRNRIHRNLFGHNWMTPSDYNDRIEYRRRTNRNLPAFFHDNSTIFRTQRPRGLRRQQRMNRNWWNRHWDAAIDWALLSQE